MERALRRCCGGDVKEPLKFDGQIVGENYRRHSIRSFTGRATDFHTTVDTASSFFRMKTCSTSEGIRACARATRSRSSR